jgi:metal-responsive CopG/Arc/MetJ family transcriptional regulator
MTKKRGDVSLRISTDAYALLNEIKTLLTKKGYSGREVSFKRIIEDALKEYKNKLEKEK